MGTKLGIILCAIFVVTFGDDFEKPYKVLQLNGCALKYEKDVPDKPDIFITVYATSGLCRLRKHQNESTENYLPMTVEYYKTDSEPDEWTHDRRRGPDEPGTIQKFQISDYQGLTIDYPSQIFTYIRRDLNKPGSRNDSLVRRRLNDSHIIDHIVLKETQHHWGWSSQRMDDLAYDWNTKNLYINDQENIAVMNLDKPLEPVNLISTKKFIRSFVIHPNAGYIFYVDYWIPPGTSKWNATSTAIYRTYLDGTNERRIGPIIPREEGVYPNLAIDYYGNRLYWNLAEKKVIQSSNLDGTDVKDVIDRELRSGFSEDSPKLITFDEKYVYYKMKGIVYRIDKQTLKEDEDFKINNDARGIIGHIMIYDPKSQNVTVDNLCVDNNGGCEHYCLPLPKNHSKGGPPRTCLSSNVRT